MSRIKLIFALVALFCIVDVYCLTDEEASDEPMQNPDLFQGDIVLVEPYEDRNAVVENHRKWPNARIPYIIEESLSQFESTIKSAMEEYDEKTCVKFVPRTDEVQYVRIFRGQGCYSHVGKTLSAQPLSLGIGCIFRGTILHELGHTVGFYHEHSRSDRDEYLDIHFENIRAGYNTEFVKLRPKQNKLYTEFDYDSVMLYGETVFSKSHVDELKTMTAKNKTITLADVSDKRHLSEKDIIRINMHYGC